MINYLFLVMIITRKKKVDLFMELQVTKRLNFCLAMALLMTLGILSALVQVFMHLTS